MTKSNGFVSASLPTFHFLICLLLLFSLVHFALHCHIVQSFRSVLLSNLGIIKFYSSNLLHSLLVLALHRRIYENTNPYPPRGAMHVVSEYRNLNIILRRVEQKISYQRQNHETVSWEATIWQCLTLEENTSHKSCDCSREATIWYCPKKRPLTIQERMDEYQAMAPIISFPPYFLTIH